MIFRNKNYWPLSDRRNINAKRNRNSWRGLVLFTVLLPIWSWAQEEEAPIEDTLAIAAMADSLQYQFVQTYSAEFVPAGDSPQVIADRLQCIEKTIPLTYNDRIHSFIDFFLIKDRAYTRMILRKKDLYFPLFEKYLKKYGLPDELKYLAIVESGLNPRAVSRARAVGLWQFISSTGRNMGLRHDWYTDDRMDPEKSTDAACRFLLQLHGMFNDWELALAAYNSGPGTVRKAIRRAGYKRNFWDIYPYLPRETRAYVPQFVAVMYALNYAEAHNIFEDAREEVMPFDTVHIQRYTHLETLAKLTGTCMEDIHRLNPWIAQNALPQNGKRFEVALPKQAIARLKDNRFAILDSAHRANRSQVEAVAQRVTGSTFGREMIVHRVRSGEVLGGIAMRHGVRVADLRTWNKLSGNLIRTGQRLTIWVLPTHPAVATRQIVKLNDSNQLGKTYVVQPGDTLWEISKRTGLTIDQLKNLNNLSTSKLQPGQTLKLG
jgi:membrane-bound lytic murein transglycosylase D